MMMVMIVVMMIMVVMMMVVVVIAVRTAFMIVVVIMCFQEMRIVLQCALEVESAAIEHLGQSDSRALRAMDTG